MKESHAMNSLVTPKTRHLLVQSLPAVEAARERIAEELSASLARSERDPELSDTPDTIATLLLSFLIEQARRIADGSEPGDLALYRTEHRLHGIEGRYYSRFGDALVPILRDALGPTHPRATASAWCDAFWAIVQRMQQDDETNAYRAISALVAGIDVSAGQARRAQSSLR